MCSQPEYSRVTIQRLRYSLSHSSHTTFPHLTQALELLDYQGRKTLAVVVAQMVVDKAAVVSSADEVRLGG